MVLRTNDTVVVLVIYILPPPVAALHGLRPLVGGGEHTSIFEYFFADVRGLIGGIGNNHLNFGEICRHTAIYCIKGHAVMYISGGDHCLQNESTLVAGGMGFIQAAV